MLPYLFLFLFCWLVATTHFYAFPQKKLASNSISALFIAISSSVLGVAAGIRSPEVGSDYTTYYDLFITSPSILSGGLEYVFSGTYYYEPGFALLNTTLSAVSDDPGFYFTSIGLLTSIILYQGIKEYGAAGLFSVAIYASYMVFTTHFTAIRFGIATLTTFLIAKKISQNHRISGLALSCIASLFHSASLILILIALFYKRLKILIFLIPIGLITSFMVGLVPKTELIETIIPSWFVRFESIMGYLDSSQYSESLSLFGLMNIKNALICAFIYYFRTKLIKDDKIACLIVFFVIGSMLRIAFHDIGFLTGRLSAVLTITEIIILPYMSITLIKQKYLTPIIILFIGLTYLYMSLFVRGFTPYETIL